MALFLQTFYEEGCLLCGAKEKLTGEHKIKASALKKEFGNNKLCITKSDDNYSYARHAQSIKSKYFKFDMLICETCNTASTQPADLEFDRFNNIAQSKLQLGLDPNLVFELKEYSEETEKYINVFRYFAKLLCCHIAEDQSPVPIRLSEFSIGKHNINYVRLGMQRSKVFVQENKELFAAHGGLVIHADKVTREPCAYYSTLTIGALQYIFFIELGEVELLEIKRFYPEFIEWCKGHSPIPKNDADKLGIIQIDNYIST